MYEGQRSGIDPREEEILTNDVNVKFSLIRGTTFTPSQVSMSYTHAD